MKSLVLSASALGLLATISPAQASTVSVGSSLAQSCYLAAESRNTTVRARQDCDTALAEEALSHFDRTGTFVNRGVLKMVAGDLDSADRDFERAIALDPGQPEAWLNKAMLQIKRGNSQAALPLIDKAIGLRTRKPAVAFYMRAIANEDSGNFRAAYADLRRARQLAPRWKLPAEELQRYQVRTR